MSTDASASTTRSPSAAASTRFDDRTGTVHAVVEIAAPPERVFQALTDPRELEAWWGSDDWYRSHDWVVDPRPGGQWSVRTTSATGGPGSTVRGEYIVVDSPRVLEYTWRASWDDFSPTTIRFVLEPAVVDGVAGTRLIMTHTGFADPASAAQSYTPGWSMVLGWLAAYVGTNRA
jgi:uncharacterized protein YndB with AHSA1/START domain